MIAEKKVGSCTDVIDGQEVKITLYCGWSEYDKKRWSKIDELERQGKAKWFPAEHLD